MARLAVGREVASKRITEDEVTIGFVGGGTNEAFPGREPPIRFWLRQTSPGSFVAPRTPRMSRSWVPFSRRIDSGGAAGSAICEEMTASLRTNA